MAWKFLEVALFRSEPQGGPPSTSAVLETAGKSPQVMGVGVFFYPPGTAALLH